jgi:hypothetical protein
MEGGARSWGHLLGRAAAAVAIYHAGLIVAFLHYAQIAASRVPLVPVPLHYAFLLVPLQVVYRREGAAQFLRVSVLSVAMLVAVRVALAASALHELATAGPQNEIERIVLAPLPGVIAPWFAVEVVTAAVLVAGLAWVNIYGPMFLRWRTVYRVLAATGAASVVALGIIVMLAANHAFVDSIKQLFTNFMDYVRKASAQAEAPLPKLPDMDAMMRLFWDYMFSGFVSGYFLNLAGSWFIGTRMALRGRTNVGPRLRGFELPEVMVWPLIASWAIVLVGHYTKLGYVAAFALNAGLILLALYAVQGLAIIETLLARSRRGPDASRLMFLGLVAAFVVPLLTILALVVVPLVGVSEIWVKYRVERKEQTDEGEGDT